MTIELKGIKNQVKEKYGTLAREQGQESIESSGCCGPSDCCSSGESTGLASMLYESSELTDLPESVTNISLGCGNPTAIARLKAGDTVLDLGSGGGIDCFLAAKAVGPTGQVIGVDMTEDMLALANGNKAKLGITNVEFRKGEIENLPVESESVDVIISNCVINLSPDKDAVFREAFRVLKSGGRFSVSDIVTEGVLPPRLQENINAWTGCIAGALQQEDYLERMRQAGFVGVAVESRSSYGLENPEMLDEATRESLFEGVERDTIPDEARVYSARIVAHKP